MQILSNLREQMYRYRVEYLKDARARRTLITEHEAIYRAVKARDEEAALMEVKKHIANQQKAIIRSLHLKE